MIKIKTAKEIETLAEGGKILAAILAELSTLVQPGSNGRQLDERVRKLCEKYQVKPSFLGYASRGHKPYPAAVCISVDEAVVHGIPNETPFKENSLVGVDMGIVYRSLYLDSAHTFPCGKLSEGNSRLLAVTRRALELGINQAQVGNTTGDIGAAIQNYVEGEGLGIVRQLVGHGVGYAVHEDPQVPNYGRPGQGDELVEGLVIAIEPMVTVGDPEVITADDGWTIVTASGGLSAHEEHTIAITADGPRILTA